MKQLIVSSEVTPFAKTGGLADVSAALARQLGKEGSDARLLMPLYRSVAAGPWKFSEAEELGEMRAELGGRNVPFRILSCPLPDSELRVRFVDCPELFDREGLYGSAEDEHLRFALLAQAALSYCQHSRWAPDVIQCNDWHSALIPIYLKALCSWDRLFERTKTLLTIHNIAYQGVFPASCVESLGLGGHRNLLHQDDLGAGVLNFMKTGLLYADAISTVSRTYAREIQGVELGMGLDGLLRARSESLVGIVNGVDYGDWNPAKDPHIASTFSAKDMGGKQKCKQWVLDEFKLSPADEAGPLIGIVSRLTSQKGFDLLPDILPVLLRNSSARLIILGSGEERLERYFQWLRDAFPQRVGFYCGYSEPLSHAIEAACDIFLMPSRYEPCGLNQMYSLRYGAVPIVRRTGGLADTVRDYDPVTGEGTGFVFDDYSSQALLHAMERALFTFRDRTTWKRIVASGMAEDFSWARQVRHYIELFERLRA